MQSAQGSPSAEPTAAGQVPDAEFHRNLVAIAPHLRAFARSLCGCRERADDLAQETMMRAWAARDRYAAGTNFKAWTFTILRNHFYTEIRRNRFVGQYDEVFAENTLRTNGAQEGSVELGDLLRAFSVLPEQHREALLLVAVGNMSYEEVAEVCGVALGTIKSRICRARAMLLNTLESGQLPDFRQNFVLKGSAIDALFEELALAVNNNNIERLAA